MTRIGHTQWNWSFGRTGLCVLLAFFGVSSALADEMLHARISHESGGALVRGSEDADWSYATVNSLILPGDTLWIDEEGTLEAELVGGSFLRLADRSKAELQSLPPNATINAWAGSFYVQRVSRSTGDFKVRTPAATIIVDKDSQVRVDVVGEGSTTVSVRWGRATIATEGGAPVEASNGQRVYVDPGLLPSNPVPFDKTADDSFDAWNRERARLLALGDNALPASVQVEQTQSAPIGYSDLASYGEWVTVESRQVWRPTVVVDYVPYRDGYWSYVPSYGYNWIDSYSFGYVTSHYGRWNYYPSYGWCWGYDPVWSPAWCATAYYGGNFVWCPLDYYNRPCSYGNTYFVNGVPYSVGFSSYCYSNDLFYGPCSVYPAYNDIFVNVNIGDVHIWNIYDNNYNHNNPYYRASSALARQYSPRRVIRGLADDGRRGVSAGVRARSLEDGMGRTKFTSNDGRGTRAIRTSQATSARMARVRDTSLNADTALDTGSTIRRAERNLTSLRGRDDGNPRASEARSARLAAIDRSAETARNSKLPGATTRESSVRSHRNDGIGDTIRGRGKDEGIAGIEPRGGGNNDRVTRGNEDRTGSATTDRNVTARTRNNTAPSDDMLSGRERREERRGDTVNQLGTTTRNRDGADGNTADAERTARREGRSSGASSDTIRIPQSTSRTLNDSRARVNTETGRTQVPETARMQQPNLPRISGGDGRNERSESLGTLPQVPQRSRSASRTPVQTFTPEASTHEPQRRVIPEGGNIDRGGRGQGIQSIQRSPEPIQMEAPRIAEQPRARYEAPQQQYQAPQIETPRYEPRSQRVEAPQPRFEAPQQRYEAPQPRYEAPQRMQAPQQRFEAPQQRMEVPQPRFEAPQSRSIEAPRGGGDGGGRSEGIRSGGGGGGDGGGGRGRR